MKNSPLVLAQNGPAKDATFLEGFHAFQFLFQGIFCQNDCCSRCLKRTSFGPRAKILTEASDNLSFSTLRCASRTKGLIPAAIGWRSEPGVYELLNHYYFHIRRRSRRALGRSRAVIVSARLYAKPRVTIDVAAQRYENATAI